MLIALITMLYIQIFGAYLLCLQFYTYRDYLQFFRKSVTVALAEMFGRYIRYAHMFKLVRVLHRPAYHFKDILTNLPCLHIIRGSTLRFKFLYFLSPRHKFDAILTKHFQNKMDLREELPEDMANRMLKFLSLLNYQPECSLHEYQVRFKIRINDEIIIQ